MHAGNKLEAAPSEPGIYFVRLNGKLKGFVDVRFQIVDPFDISSYSYSAQDLWFNGESATEGRLKLTLSKNDGDSSSNLQSGKDYRIDSWWNAYRNRRLASAPSEPGYYRVKLAAIEPLKGEIYAGFEIKDSHELYNYTRTYKDEVVFDGAPMTISKLGLKVHAVDDAGKSHILTYGQDYTVTRWSLENPDGSEALGNTLETVVRPGYYTMTLSGKGAYRGSVNVFFYITQVPIANATYGAIAAKTYTGKAINPQPQVTFNRQTLKNGVDYTLAYLNAKKQAIKASSVKSAGVYYVKITGKGNFKGTKTQKFIIAKADIARSTAAKIGAQAYTGKAITPKPKLTLNGQTLKYNTDYTLTYLNAKKQAIKASSVKNVGSYYVKVMAKSSFKGSKLIPFTIAKADIAKSKVAKLNACAYTGKAVKPLPTITFGGKTLKKGVDYTLAYKSNIKTGKAQVIIAGKRNFKGKKIMKFAITKSKVSLVGASIAKIKDQKLKKNGKAVKPKVTVTHNGIKLKAGKDYAVTYMNNKKKGTAKVIVKGMGAYKGSKTVKFKIT